jgi:hypothetical protein
VLTPAMPASAGGYSPSGAGLLPQVVLADDYKTALLFYPRKRQPACDGRDGGKGSMISVVMRQVMTFVLSLVFPAGASAAPLERIGLSEDKQKLVRGPSGKPFTPWGFNYDRDYRMRLIEDYWIDEWATVESDFREMKALGANVVRIHLSFATFMDAPDKPNTSNVAQLKRLVKLCEDVGIHLDVTGLGMYRLEAAPPWYMRAEEASRWKMQAEFWSAIAEACGQSPAVAWFDLANEPVVPREKRKDGEWAVGKLQRFWYGQFIVLDPAGRARGDIARAWVRQMSAAIKRHDPHALITVGMLPFVPPADHPSVGFDANALHDELDLMCVHVYPEKAPEFKQAMTVLERMDRGKPVVIEEYFPLKCKPQDLPAFVEMSKRHADGWIGFYWGQGVEELEQSKKWGDALTLGWLKTFTRMRPVADME